MSDDLRRTLKSGLSGKRRKSLFRRIADSISSFVPSGIFPPSHTAENDAQSNTRYSCDYSGGEQLSANSATQSRDCDTQTAAILNNCDVLNVDLDALDHSDGEMSAHSSTSGVSSLLPRNVVKSRNRTRTNYRELHNDTGFSLSRISATCSDVTDSVASASTFRPSSVTPWIMSLKCKPAETLDCNRPLKKQRLSSNQSQCSSLSETDHQSLFYRSKTTYGGASSFRNGPHDVFATTMPLRFELEPAANSSTSESVILNGSNLSSTARRILESLERFSTPLAIADRVPLPVYPATSQRPVAFPLKKTFRSHRFPPYLHAYTHLKYLQNRKTGVGVNESVREVSKNDEQRPWSNPVLSVSSEVTSETLTHLPNPPGLCATTVGAIGFQNLPLLTASKVMHDTTPKSDFCLLDTFKPSFSVHTASSSVSYTFASPIRRLPSVASQLALRSLQEPALKYTFSAPERPCRSSTSASPTSSAESFICATKSKSESTFSKSVSSPILSLIMESTDKPDYSTSLQNGKLKMCLHLSVRFY
ncbi:uncharacterized protein DEA37_0009190 [Paragonimus westermani]|uniref:Nucleoporin Nup153 N-terminal domain-containing protein n=2 Tax=Paragonimus westermani TaxID=34504 RepID=A0A5J4NPF3_9TREM|nr:uncharacterized protein DEA37_0009190 [Paragonimus westermani]